LANGGYFSLFDEILKKRLSDIPSFTDAPVSIDIVDDEVLGWAAMFDSHNYNIAAEKFETCWERAKEANIIELGAYYGWCWSKARYLGALQGDGTKEEALSILESAINRGGSSSWFNRMRASNGDNFHYCYRGIFTYHYPLF
jgi:hypothetical protein